jgi:hypothetical protein
MLITIVQHAPRWVWFVLAALLALGVSQLFSRHVSVQRATLLPIALAAASSYGVVMTFAQAWLALAAWATGVAAALALTIALEVWRGVTWSARDERLVVPGSWVPMLLIVARFSVKFGVGASLALGPSLAGDPGFAAAVGLTYGGFSGVFLGRGLVMWQVARQGLQTTRLVATPDPLPR